MSEVRWTPAQAAAIDDRGGTLLVSAAAGSGKTAVLVERAVQLLTDSETPVAADRLLIVTFTRAAAEELRGRIAQRLAEESAKEPRSAFLRRQRILLGRAPICTIDAYCQQLLRRYFSELNLPPDFTLADEATAHALRQNALSEVLEQLYEDADFCNFASLYGRARSDGSAAGSVLALYDFIRTLPHPAQALSQLCADYEGSAPLSETKWGAYLLQAALNAVQNALSLTLAARRIVAQESALENYDKALSEDEAFFTALTDLLRQARWDDAANYVHGFKPSNFKAVRNYEGGDMETVKALRAEAKDAVKKLKEHVFVCSSAEFDEDRARIAPMLRALAHAVTLFSDQFFAAKLAEKALEYSDFEHLALELLCDASNKKTAIARQISQGFDAVMVDEYQDTNALQALLYQCLANDDGSNLFFVGDVKQSIYRFRLASPEIFIGKRESFAPYEKGGRHPATLVLGHNFRSAGNIIGQVNYIFSCLMSRTVGDVDYNTDEMLYQGTDDAFDGGAMDLKIVDVGEESSLVGDAAAVADTICNMVRSGYRVREKGGGTRPCTYGDFCILLRSRAKFAVYAAELGRAGVPSFADTGENWLTSAEVSPVLSLLRIIDNPAQDVHMAAVLVSAMFRFTPDDLTHLRLISPRGSLFAALLQSEDVRCVDFCKTLRTLRTLAATISVDALCGEIFARTHYFSAVGAMENGAARRENLRALTSFAAGCGAALTGGLSGFLRYTDSMLDAGSMQAAETPKPPQGTVSIMTVHRSKGLEFPICILADTARQFNLRDASNAVLLHPTLGIGLNLRAEQGGLFATAPHRAIRFAQRAESISEEMRILYVALTRARDKLIVTCPLKKPENVLSKLAVGLAGAGGADAYLFSQQLSFGAWLCAAALLHPDCEELRRKAGGAMLPLRDTACRMTAEIVPLTETQQVQTEQAFVRTAVPDAQLLAALRENFAREDSFAALSTLPAKLSVSALSHKDAAPILSRPSFLYKEGLTAAESGTAQHSFLQFADFEAAAQNLPEELRRLVDGGYLDKTLAEKLPLAKIETFLQTPLAARMRSAETLLREYDFITAVPAKFVAEMPGALAYQPVLIQGIADVVLINGGEAEIADYKTDKRKTPQQFIEAYAEQLRLYRVAVEKRLGVKVTACTIYSFALGMEISVPL